MMMKCVNISDQALIARRMMSMVLLRLTLLCFAVGLIIVIVPDCMHGHIVGFCQFGVLGRRSSACFSELSKMKKNPEGHRETLS